MTDMPEAQDSNESANNEASEPKLAGKWSTKLFIAVLLLTVFALMASLAGLVNKYRLAQALVSISDTTAISPEGGVITIQYRLPVSSTLFSPKSTVVVDSAGKSVEHMFHSALNASKTVETIKFRQPTPFNRKLILRRSIEAPATGIVYSLGLTPVPGDIAFTTAHEKFSIDDLIPSASEKHAPEVLNNQIAISFNGKVGKTYRKRVKLTPRELPFIQMSPLSSGYFQWSDHSTLTFNFTEERPQFDTTYSFDILPEKLLNPDIQLWEGKTSITLTTSANDVYVNDVSIDKEVSWDTPIEFEFSGNMVGVFDLKRNKANDVMPLTMTPDVEGTWRWQNARTVKFTPGTKGWPTRKTIAIEFLPRVNQEADRNWTNNRGLNRIEFSVRPRLQSVSNISLRGNAVDPEARLEIMFSRELMSKSHLGTSYSLSQNQAPVEITPAVTGTYHWEAPSKLVVQPDKPWSELTEYKIALHPDFNPDKRFEWSGAKTFNFTTAENVITPKAYQIPEQVPSGADFYGNKQRYQLEDTIESEKSIWIEFNRPFGIHHDVASAEAGVQITPAIEGTFKWLSDTLLSFSPTNGWQPETDYTLSLQENLLYFHEQHYAPNSAALNFRVNTDVIEFTPIESIDPAEIVELNFNKRVKTLVKVGRKYLASEIENDLLPLQWDMRNDYQLEWTNDKSLRLIPLPYWPANVPTQFTLNEKILPRTSSHFHKSKQTKLVTKKNIVRIDDITPSGLAQRNTDIEIEFNRDIRPASNAVGGIENSGLITVEPELAGAWHWQSDSRLVFKAESPLAPATDYTLTVHPDKISNPEFTWFELDEKGKAKPNLNYFHSAYQQVKHHSSTFDFDENDPLKQRFFIDLTLSEDTTFAEIEKRFTLWTENIVNNRKVEVPLIYRITTKEPKDKMRTFRVVSDFIDRPKEDRAVYFQLGRGVPALGGNAVMTSDYQGEFLQEKPRFIKIYDIMWNEEGRRSARLQMRAPVEPAILKSFFTITERYDSQQSPLEYSVSVDDTSSSSFFYLIDANFKPNTEYKFALKEGLLAVDGALTMQDIEYNTTPRLEARSEFAFKGNILSKYDAQQVPIMTSNLEQFRLRVDKIFPSNVRNFLNSGLGNERELGSAGKNVFDRIYLPPVIHDRENISDLELTTHIDLAPLFERNPKGLYRLSLNGWRHERNYRWFMSSDIALIARRANKNIYVWSMSLSAAKPLPDTKIELVDAWNQTVSTGYTDGTGFVRLDNPDPNNSHILLASKGNDFSFLDLRTQTENLDGFDVSGIESVEDASRLQAFLYSDRGVYRPGDTVHLVGVVRDQSGALPNPNNVTLQLKDPGSSERLTDRFAMDGSGVITLDYTIPADAKTGRWSAQLSSDRDNIGAFNFQVEEFIPNKIKVEISSKKPSAYPGQTFVFDIQANNLFGPPAAGREVVGHVSLRPAFFHPVGYSDYQFGHDDYRFQQVNTDLVETRLDENGHHSYEYQVPEGIESPIGLNLHYNATVIDDSGRGVAQYAEVPIHLYERYVGVRRLANNTIEVGDNVVFETVNVTGSGTPIAATEQSFQYQVFRKRKVTHYRKNERGYYRYVTEKIDTPLLDQVSSANRFEYQSEFSGEHYLQVTDLIGRQVTRIYFSVVGKRDDVSIVEAPEEVMLKARQSTSEVGSELIVDVRAPFAGQLLLIVERDDVMWTKAVEMSESSIAVTLPITAEHVPNFYLSAIVVRPNHLGSRRQPVYSTGMLNVTVRDPKQTPKVTITAPKNIAPNEKLEVSVSASGDTNGELYFTLAAVDEGILDLTKFETPNMKNAFTRKQRLDVDHFSVYPWVMPFDDDILHSISPSGSAPSRALIRKKRENPDAMSRVKSVSLWSGLQKFDSSGNATYTFDVPEFDGSLRLMLVTFGDQRYNSAQAEVVVRDDLVLKPSLPRFMANGDHFELPFNVFSSAESDDNVHVSIEHSDHLELLGNNSQKLAIKAGGETNGQFSFNVKDRLGLAEVTLVAQGSTKETTKTTSIPVRSSGNYVSLAGAGAVDFAAPKTIQIPQAFKPGTENFGLSIEPAGLLEYTGSLQYLLRYPHGCLEQTTSKLFPLLYFEDFAKSANFHEFKSSTPRYFLREGVDKIERMQVESGHFSYWSGGESVNRYASIYAMHFLTEARKKGLEVNKKVWDNSLDRLDKDVLRLVSEASDYEGTYNLSHQVYALYVLALSGNARVSEMNTLLQNKKFLLKAHDRARLAAAFLLVGRKPQADELLVGSLGLNQYDNAYRQTAGAFASNVRDLAILLDAMLEVDPQSSAISQIVDKLTSLREDGRWGSTQDNAMALMALGKSISRSAKIQNGDIIVTLPNGEERVNESVVLSTLELLSGEVSIRATGDAKANYFWQADGVSNEVTVKDIDQGIRVRRQFLNTQKEKIDLSKVRQGDLVIVELTMSADIDILENVAVIDLLPMGLEIENARLSTSTELPWLKSTAKVDHADIRDDRMNLYLTLGEEMVVYYYTTRAVTVGRFAVPSVRAEAMYDESKYSLNGAGHMKILPMK